MLIDLRSDTVTQPSAAMRDAMARAPVGDDVYGEDPTVRALEERVAALLGMEAAVFVPSGTMANQIAIGAQAGPGDEVLCEASSHVISYEGGGIAALWGIQPRALPGDRGVLRPAQIETAIQLASDDHLPRTGLICIENTHNRGGGRVWPLEDLRAVAELARTHALPLHVDGARLWNAAVALSVPPAALVEGATTVSVCLSKGLGAPVGSLVAGPKALEPTFRRLRKRLGGGLRQAGILAAAGLFALEHHLPGLGSDHDNARSLAAALADVPGLSVEPVETNLVFVGLPPGRTAQSVQAALLERGVAVGVVASDRLRLVTHRDVDADACLRAAEALRALLLG